MRLTDLSYPPNTADPAVDLWLRRVREAVTELQTAVSATSEIVIAQGPGEWATFGGGVSVTGGSYSFSGSGDYASAFCPLPVGTLLTGITVNGRNSGAGTSIDIDLLERSDAFSSGLTGYATKNNDTTTDVDWTVEFSGTPDGLPRAVREDHRLEVLFESTSAGTTLLSSIIWKGRAA